MSARKLGGGLIDGLQADEDNWSCLKYDSHILESIKLSKAEAVENSIYTKVTSLSFEDVESYLDVQESSSACSADELYDARRIMYLHGEVDDEITRINFDILDEIPLQQTKEQILDEFDGDQEKADEEINLYVEEYNKHLNILHDQLAELESSSDALGVLDIHKFTRQRQDNEWIAKDMKLKESMSVDDIMIAPKAVQNATATAPSSSSREKIGKKAVVNMPLLR